MRSTRHFPGDRNNVMIQELALMYFILKHTGDNYELRSSEPINLKPSSGRVSILYVCRRRKHSGNENADIQGHGRSQSVLKNAQN